MRRLTEKQQKFIEKLNAGITPVVAAEDLYRCKNRNVARVIASKNVNHPVIFEKVRDALDYPGSKARVEHIVKVIEDGLTANKTIVTRVGDLVEVPDHKTRLYAAQLALRVRGELKDIVVDNTSHDIHVSFKLIKARSPEEVARVMGDTNTRATILESETS
jgi:hypothetical protein